MNAKPDLRIDALLRGAVDLRCENVDPAAYVATAKAALEVGMRAVAFLDDGFSPTPAIRMLERAEPLDGIALLSGIVLNEPVGGLNPFAVEHDLKFGGRIVTMPTIAALNHRRETRTGGATHSALTVLDSRGKLRPAVIEILELIAEHDAILGFGHLHASEIWPLHEAATAHGVNRQLLTFVDSASSVTAEERLALARSGVFIEQCGGNGLATLVDAVGAGRIVLTSGPGTPDGPIGALRATIEAALANGIPEEVLRRILCDNPASLLDTAGDPR